MADSPLSDDSLSSIGASTEPLPTSDGPAPDVMDVDDLKETAHELDVRSSPPTSRPKAKRAASSKRNTGTGHDSDSTLTEQSSSDGHADLDEEDDDPGQPTPRAKGNKRKAVNVPDDEEDDDDDTGNVDGGNAAASSPPPPRLTMPDVDDGSELSSMAPSEKEDDEEGEGEVDRDGAQSPSLHAASAGSDQDDKTPRDRNKIGKARLIDDDVENEALSPPSDDHEEAAEERRKASVAAKRSSTRGRGTKTRAGRGRGRGGKRAVAARHEHDTAAADESSDVESVTQDAAPIASTTSTAKRGKAARGRGGRGKRGGARGGAQAPERQRSTSTEDEHREATPASIVKMEEKDMAAERDALVDSEVGAGAEQTTVGKVLEAIDAAAAVNIDAPSPTVAVNGLTETGEEHEQDQQPEEPTDEHAVLQEGDAEMSVEPAAEEERALPKKRGGKKGKKGTTKSKDRTVTAGEGLEEEDTGTPAASDHEDDQDDVQSRKRVEAMEELTKIEIAFATLRNRLYVERMQEVEQERIGVETGTHPELIHLNRLIELRRKTKLDMAKKLLDGLVMSYEKRLIEAEHAAWQHWADGRNELRSTMYEEAMGKRRKLEREKRQLDRPKEDTLASLLAPRPLPAVPLYLHRRAGFDAELTTVHEILWSTRNVDVRIESGVSCLDDEAARSDLEHMGLREPAATVAPFAYDAYAILTPQQAPALMPPPPVPAANGYPYVAAAQPTPPTSTQHGQMVMAPTLMPFAPPYMTPYSSALAPPPPPPPVSAGSSATNQHMPLEQLAPLYPPPGTMAYPTTYLASDQDRLGGPWQANISTSTSIPFDESRRRTRTPSGSNLFADSLDQVARQRERSHDGSVIKHDSPTRHRPSLDDHMAHARSPKQQRSSNSTSSNVGTGGSSAPFMQIPSFRQLQRESTNTTIASSAGPFGANDIAQQHTRYPSGPHKPMFRHSPSPSATGMPPQHQASTEPMRAT
ncbi:hypothetical protein OIO90_002188 [Microbotryomycetes sp. JL221]|nr:hypothetical protein OIO90_002188 [Microbotryomycetes sp. JL221]